MDNTSIKFPIHMLDGKELLPAGENCSAATLQSTFDLVSTSSVRLVNLMAYDTIQKDLASLLTIPPYDTIFANADVREHILDIIRQVTVPQAMLEAMDYFKEYDWHTYRHMLAIYALSILLALELEPSGVKRFQEAAAGPSHDIGKINVPIDILTKNQPLTQTESDQVKHHTLAGYVHLACYFRDTSNHAARLARDHHERLDRSGYPRGILQNDPFVEVITVADIYDALISPRHYRPEPYDNRSAIEEITRMAELGKISWDTLKALVAFNRSDKPDRKSFSVSHEKRGTAPANNSYGIIVDHTTGSRRKY